MLRPVNKRRITPDERAQFRAQLIEIARRIFLEEGYSAVTIRRLTAEAGVTAMAFYWYFESKDALLTVIWDEFIKDSADACQAAASAEERPAAKVVTYFATFLDYWLARRDRFRFIFLSDSHNTDFISLRRALFAMPGVSQHFAQYDALLAPMFQDRLDASERINQLRTLSMYRVFGFLYCTVGIYDYDEAETARLKRLVADEMGRCLDHWCTH